MKWFGRSKKKETIDNKAKHTAKLKKDDETASEKITSKSSTQKIETESKLKKDDTINETKNTDSISNKLQLVKEEYNEVVGNLMRVKREQKSVMEKIQ